MAKHITTGAKRRSRRAKFLLPLAAAAALAGCRPLLVRQISPQLIAVAGHVAAAKDGRTFPLTTPQWLPPGAALTTGPASRADIALLPGIVVRLDPDSAIVIRPPRFARDGNESIHPMQAREARLRLLRGRLIASVGLAQTRSRLFVETAAGTLASDSARTFEISAPNPGAIRILCARGPADFQPAGPHPAFQIKPGYLADWPPPATGPNPRPIAAEPGPTQADFAHIFAIEKQLLVLEKAALARDARILPP
ncbi:MAG TPA: FecR domain-containing protein [Chthoniobacterales bacterium]